MTTSSRLAYAQARLQARHGRRPTEDGWRLLEATPDLASYLQSARSTSLRPWVVQLPAESDSHRIEQSMRADWREYVSEISGWTPAPWRHAVDWLATLPYLSYFTHLARNRPVPQWMLDDPVLAEFAQADPERRREALAATSMGRMLPGIAESTSPIIVWLDGWAELWPVKDGPELMAMQGIRMAFETHIATILDRPLDHPVGPPLRRHLLARLTMAFRRQSGRIAAVFAHLGLMWLDMERLRGGLVLRALFPDPAERPQWA